MHKACDSTVWKLIKQNLNATHLWIRSNKSTSPLVFSPLLNISSVKSKQLYGTIGGDSYISQWFSNTPHVFLSFPVQDVLLYIILNFDCHVTCVGVCQSGQYFTNVTPFIYNRQKYVTFHHRPGFRVTKLCTLSGALQNCLDYTMNIMKCDIYGFDRFLKV